MRSDSSLALTFDIDWAPDFAIDEIAEFLLDRKIKATFFVTHNSSAISRLQKYHELFEMGLHPNFYPGSTHGKTEEEVMKTVKDLLPEAIAMRTHGLYQNSRFLKMIARDFGIKIDVSLFLPYVPYIQPHILDWSGNKKSELFRIPYFWEDDFEILSENPAWTLQANRFKNPGLKIFNFHPVHIALNTCDCKQYEQLKGAYDVSRLTLEDVKPFVNSGSGVKTFFIELIEKLFLAGGGKRIKDIYENYRS